MLNEFSKYLFSRELLESVRLKPHFFTRDRVLTFPTVPTFLLSGLQSAVQAELDRGFPSRGWVSMLTARGIPFCIRCDHSGGFKAVRYFLASGFAEKVVCLRPPDAGDAAA